MTTYFATTVPLHRRILPYLLLSLVACIPRFIDLGGFVGEDEIRYWIPRSHTFLKAIQSGDYAATAISTHPGVTTMWCGSIGIMLQRMLLAWGIVDSMPFPMQLTLMRLPVVCIHTIGLLVSYHVLRQWLGGRIALLAALLWATDPFIIAFSRMLHVDGLTMTFATVSLLAAWHYWTHQSNVSWLIVSGACAGLAVLSKSPGIAVVPIVAIIAFRAHFSRRKPQITSAGLVGAAIRSPHWHRISMACRFIPHSLFGWGVAWAITMVLVWPAFWVNPMRVSTLMRIGVEVEGGSPHVQGNFFLGKEDNEPGWLFYPVAFAMRMTPWAMFGLMLLPLALWQWRKRREQSPTSSDNLESLMSLITILAGFALLFLAGLSLFPKKLNRYLIPMFPAINILAAMGILAGGELLGTLAKRVTWIPAMVQARWVPLVTSGIVLVAIIHSAWWHPYYLTYFNPFLGGARAGAATFLIGLGEGLEQVAAWLNEQPDITHVVTVATMPSPLQPYLRRGAHAALPHHHQLRDQTGYVVVYVRNVWGNVSPPFDRFYRKVAPIYQVTIHGVEYAWVYLVPKPLAHQSDAIFGSAIRLDSYEVDTSLLRLTGTITLSLQWQALSPIAEDYHCFIHVLDERGERVGQADVPPGGPASPTSSWSPHRYVYWKHPVPLSPHLPSGTYWIAIGLYRPHDFSRLELHDTSPPLAVPIDAGPHALFLTPMHIPEEEERDTRGTSLPPATSVITNDALKH